MRQETPAPRQCLSCGGTIPFREGMQAANYRARTRCDEPACRDAKLTAGQQAGRDTSPPPPATGWTPTPAQVQHYLDVPVCERRLFDPSIMHEVMRRARTDTRYRVKHGR